MTASHLPPETALGQAVRREQMSSLADGELGGSSEPVAQAVAVWRQDADARETWHRYHLIGDVMRSEDLAQQPAHDLDFLNRLRERMEAEPVHLIAAAPELVRATVPTPSISSHRAWGDRWRTGFALAASVAVATVVLLVSRTGAPGADASAPVVASNGASGVPALPGAVNSAGVLRDPRLDEFLRLHQVARGGLPVGTPGGTLQRADLQMPVGAAR